MDFVKLSDPLNCLTVEKCVSWKSQWEFCLDGLGTVFPVDSVYVHLLNFLIACFLLLLESKLRIHRVQYSDDSVTLQS